MESAKKPGEALIRKAMAHTMAHTYVKPQADYARNKRNVPRLCRYRSEQM